MRKLWKAGISVLLLTLLLTTAAFAAPVLKDGTYQVAVTLSGGTGRVTIESPCQVTVANGQATATVVLDSKNYDYMRIDDQYYNAVHGEGTSAFEIPVVLGTDVEVAAQTTAMSQPHEVAYQLHFDVAPVSGQNSVSMIVWVGAGVAGVAVAVVVLVVRKKKRG
ncbi:MAG: hypothetical protein GXW99_03055 [Clostridiales bacterium]|nr:hypothetical protein [Clostridiales bacterium]